ncbi:uncharacterized protein LOC107217142 [Neodiprion lecontei]|uniref:Proteasome assembly chaperone 1 n=1 Tax=Neodiprion lecontei TaxID=441921 RepID=A0A6J0B739_NEOLC|nr:uncharacterized protein LOC107217142 [Neodiprion lecontei]
MAQIFGEIVEPESRAFWDDDELDASQFQYQLRWSGDNVMPSSIKTFLIVEGSVVSDFTRMCSLGRGENEICIIEHGRFKASNIYKINNDLYTCLVSPDLDAKHSTEFIATLTDFLLNAEKIITLTCQHVSSYKSDVAPILPSFLQSLSTKSGKSPLNDVERVKQPNIVHGIAAGVMSYAEIFELSAVLYVLYVEEFLLDSETAMPLVKLFAAIPGSLLHDPVFKQSSFSSRVIDLYYNHLRTFK